MFIITLPRSIALALASAVFIGYESVQLRQDTAAELATLTEMTASDSTAPLSFEDRQSSAETLQALRAERHIIEACVYGQTGQIFAVYTRDSAAPPCPKTPPRPGHHFA